MQKIKILLVDDEENFVKTLTERMRMRNLGPEVALNGEQALTMVDDKLPDVIVLDLKMPGIDGLEVLRRVKSVYPQVQVIILTGHGSDKDEQEARRLGAFEYLQKPVDIRKLTSVIKKAYKSKFEDTMTAGAFAEAGDVNTAKDILESNKKSEQRD
ncbi:MAG: response regulator [Deltaproteobacteria bacterium]|nr:response regulator [Deltaproteobacteria bacterium]MBW1995122.1 response regulator [Deltaproteobacteria bacterium]MBW2154181.1 response regulator [Deltaproteobacteria bacterium]